MSKDMRISTPSKFRLKFNQSPDVLLNDYDLSFGAKEVYRYLYSKFINSNSLQQDESGHKFLTVKRATLAKVLCKAVSTIIRYVKELVKCGLIDDKRIGINQINHIYIKDVDDKYKCDTEPEQEVDGSIKQVKQLINPVQEIKTKQAKQLLMLCDGDLDILRQSIEYTLTMQYDDFLAYLCKVLNHKWYKPKEPPQRRNKPTNTKTKQKGKFYAGESHDFNYDKMQELEDLLLMKQTGQISEEEYNLKIELLDLE